MRKKNREKKKEKFAREEALAQLHIEGRDCSSTEAAAPGASCYLSLWTSGRGYKYTYSTGGELKPSRGRGKRLFVVLAAVPERQGLRIIRLRIWEGKTIFRAIPR